MTFPTPSCPMTTPSGCNVMWTQYFSPWFVLPKVASSPQNVLACMLIVFISGRHNNAFCKWWHWWQCFPQATTSRHHLSLLATTPSRCNVMGACMVVPSLLEFFWQINLMLILWPNRLIVFNLWDHLALHLATTPSVYDVMGAQHFSPWFLLFLAMQEVTKSSPYIDCFGLQVDCF